VPSRWTQERVDELSEKVMRTFGGDVLANALVAFDLRLDSQSILSVKDRTRKLMIVSAVFLVGRNEVGGTATGAIFTKSEIQVFYKALKLFPYPIQSAYIRSLVVLGNSPKAISGNRLTNAEAHQWLSEVQIGGNEIEHLSAQKWFLLKYAGVDSHGPFYDNSGHVWNWLRRMLQSPQQRAVLLHDPGPGRAVRFWRGADGGMHPAHFIGGAFIYRVDELEPVDLTDGVRSSFERAVLRLELENADVLPDERLAEPPQWWVDDPRVKLLLTARELAAEGCDMHHCVGDYAQSVKMGQQLIFTISFPGCRSTVAVDPASMHIRQHRGSMNSDPSKLCKRFLEKLQTAWFNELSGRAWSLDGLRRSRERKQLSGLPIVKMKVIG